MADLFTQDLEDAQNLDEGLGSGSEGMSGDGEDDLCDDPSSALEEMCQGARLDLLEEHQRSDNPYHRQAVVRTLQSSLRAIGGIREDAERLLSVATQLSRDVVEDIRCDLVDQVPHLAMVCHASVDEHGDTLDSLISSHLLPIVISLLADQNKMINKTAQGALLALLEQGFLPPDVVEAKLVPLVVNWTLVEDVELNTSSVGLMTKMAPVIGQESTIVHFLEPFSELCEEQQLYVRKVCATNFGDFAAVIGAQKTEEILMAKFMQLCRDAEWAVRKACAEVFTAVSHAVTMIKRRSTLACIFHHLLRDDSRWVQVAAFQSLGSFIATFGDPEQHPSSYDHHVLLDTEGVELAYRAEANCSNAAALRYETVNMVHDQSQRHDTGNMGHGQSQQHNDMVIKTLGYSPQKLSHSQENLPEQSPDDEEPDENEEEKLHELGSHLNFNNDWDEDEVYDFNNDSSVFHNTAHHQDQQGEDDEEPTQVVKLESSEQQNEEEQVEQVSSQDLAQQSKVIENQENFNTFLYWRLPVPDLDLSDTLPSPVDNNGPQAHQLCDNSQIPPMSPLVSLMPDHLPSPKSAEMCMSPNRPSMRDGSPVRNGRNLTDRFLLTERLLKNLEMGDIIVDSHTQEIVPPVLIDHFVSMASPMARAVDSEISHHCAFSLPAVVLTLGRENWHLLKITYRTLASDMQWKVRRTMASSIHEVALILGQDLASTDLMPIFYGFVKDLDEVRIGILKHLTEFLKILRPDECEQFLPSLSKFLQMDHHSNWRYREELANQLVGVLDLCTPEQARAHVAPIALALLDDKVAAVREAALPLVAKVTRKLAEDAELLDRLISRFNELFVTTERWMRRQSFALLCGQLMRPPQPALSPETFSERLLPLLADLAKDPVPNVRLSVAQSLAQDIEPYPYFSKGAGAPLVQQVLHTLQCDRDRDVKFFSGGATLDDLLEVSVLTPLSMDTTNQSLDTTMSLDDQMADTTPQLQV